MLEFHEIKKNNLYDCDPRQQTMLMSLDDFLFGHVYAHVKHRLKFCLSSKAENVLSEKPSCSVSSVLS